MERQGKTLKDLGPENPRRIADGKNAWRKMSWAQRVQFLRWIAGATEFRKINRGAHEQGVEDAVLGIVEAIGHEEGAK